MRKAIYLLPATVFVILAIVWGVGLTKDSRVVPSVLIDKPAPTFTLPPIDAGMGKGFATTDLKASGVSVVNVFASWCIPCREEHAVIAELAGMKIARVYGLNYKDDATAAKRWLTELGNPYTDIGADRDGRVGIDWGVYGVPETFVIDSKGTIRYKRIGPVSKEVLNEIIVPLIKGLQKG
jgi:cytochrome c biogenesis protein CcmG, thiol:disulfide interchange protein DsbE